MMKIYDLNQVPEEEIFARQEEAADVSAPVADILRDVKERGDAALLDYAKKFDKAELSALEVTPPELEEGAAQVDGEFTAILREAAGNIRAFHAKQKREGFLMAEREGVILGQKITPLARVGIYVPGGTAAYPSTVLMNAIPAHIAGVGEIIMATPPGRDGKIRPAILAAAKLAGVTRIFKMGGAQAVAALAYGTESVPKVDKIVGPGNAYVAEARQRLCGRSQAAGVRPGEHRHDRRPLRGVGYRRREVQPRLGGRRPAQPGGARQDGLRRAGHRLPGAGPGRFLGN